MRRLALARPSGGTLKWTAASLVLLAGLAVLGVSMSHETPQRAQTHLDNGDPDAALHELKHAGPFLYFSADYHALKARAQQMLGQLDEAEASMAWALWLDEENAQYYQRRSDIRKAQSSRDQHRARELSSNNAPRREILRFRGGYGRYHGDRRYDDDRDYRGYRDHRRDFDEGIGRSARRFYEEDHPRSHHSRWEEDADHDMSLWDEADHSDPPLSDEDRHWVDELDRLGESVLEQQSTHRSYGAPRALLLYTGESM